MRKSALIVDDSKTARVVLKRMLETHELDVDTVESAESALDYLNDHRPDVIFMDHLMPGMDGFEAVTAIKNNPDTATIPIMMYTSQKGEVYVGQARALGAIGVLPKEVEPVEVSKVLKSLRVIGEGGEREKAAAAAGKDEPTGEMPGLEKFDHDLRELIQDLFDQQRAVLRRDLLDSYETIASRVADEIRLPEADKTEDVGEQDHDRVPARFQFAVALLSVVIVIFGWLYWQREQDWKEAREQNALLMAAMDKQRSIETDGTIAVQQQIDSYQQSVSSTFAMALESIEWAVNLASQYSFDELPLGDRRLSMLEELTERLLGLGFSGEVVVTAHVGDFCMMSGGPDGLQLAPAELRASDCDVIGREPGDATRLGLRQSVAFANFISIVEEQTDGQITYAVESRGNRDRLVAYPSVVSGITAGAWNEVAGSNNRVEISLRPDGF